METTDFQMEMKTVITGTEKKTFSVSRVWDESKPSCIVVELYPTLSMHRFHSKTAFHKELRRVLHINGCDAKPREIKGYQYYLDISLKSNYLNNVKYQ
jgi:hypothetical protein